MKEVFRHSDAALVALRQALLESEGIATYTRNVDTQQAMVGGVLAAVFPLPDFWPILCVVNDEDYPAAMAILRDAEETPAAAPDWTCPKCRETVPGQFAECWNCGQPSPEPPAASG